MKFKRTIWIVPEETLKAYTTLNRVHLEVSNQTVWTINREDDGYIFGTSYTTLDGIPSSKNSFVGSISSNGNVSITFYQDDLTVLGTGSFVKYKKDHQFIMNMNNIIDLSSHIQGLSHWSYMRKVDKKDFEYYHLPGVNISVPEFIKLFE